MRLTIFLTLALLSYGCKNSKKNIDPIIRELISLDKKSLFSQKISMMSRDINDNRAILTDYYSNKKGFIILKINEDCRKIEIDESKWSDTNKLNPKNINKIGTVICKLGLNGIAIDSCGNTYFSLTNSSMYEFVLVKNQKYLNEKFSYKKYKGRCYSILY